MHAIEETEMASEYPAAPDAQAVLRGIVDTACRRIPPLWPLGSFVAVNPFVGLDSLHVAEAAALLDRNAHGDILPSGADLLARIAAAGISDADVAAAVAGVAPRLRAAGHPVPPLAGLAALRQALAAAPAPAVSGRTLSVADVVDAVKGTSWNAFVVDEVSKWCSSYFDEGQSAWRMPGRGEGLYRFWRAIVQSDRNPACAGLRTFSAVVPGLPGDPLEAVGMALAELGTGGLSAEDFLHRQLLSVAGWSGHAQYRARVAALAGGTDATLVDLLAIRLAYDLALFRQFGGDPQVAARWAAHLAQPDAPLHPSADHFARLVALQVLEARLQQGLVAGMALDRDTAPAGPRPLLHAVFCIDVRSEVYRRCLEAQSDGIRTSGFAGFFGMAVEFEPGTHRPAEARCPVLIPAKVKVRSVACRKVGSGSAGTPARPGWRERMADLLDDFKTSAGPCFPFVETLGLWSGVSLVRDAFAGGGETASRASGDGAVDEALAAIPAADRAAMAEGALRGMGMLSGFAKVVLLCGHGSTTANNPYAASLDCGACGGHAGDVNARLAAALLNDREVRAALKGRGIAVPDDTVFVAGLHDTTSDVVAVDWGAVATADRAGVEQWLGRASALARRRRAPALGLSDVPDAGIDGAVARRTRDWSEVRPEWGLAGNAAFVAAPRRRTAGLDLGGRVFLHDYEPSKDPGHSVLELILTAPVVVASWINLQYYASTVNPALFGSGDKALHNVVGTLGVWEGNGGDLRVGLPFQSVHDGTRPVHEPFRLAVFVEADRAAVDAILRRHAHPRNLVANGWIHLFAIEPGGGAVWRCNAPGEWSEWPGRAA